MPPEPVGADRPDCMRAPGIPGAFELCGRPGPSDPYTGQQADRPAAEEHYSGTRATTQKDKLPGIARSVPQESGLHPEAGSTDAVPGTIRRMPWDTCRRALHPQPAARAELP